MLSLYKENKGVLLTIALVIFALMFISACGGPAADEPSEPSDPDDPGVDARRGGRISFGRDREATSLDPHSHASIISAHTIANIVEPLIYLDDQGQAWPGLATSWSANDDATEFTFQLREDVVFHDGEPFNGEAVKYNFDRIASPELIEGGARVALGPYYQETVVEGEYEVRVVFEQPYAIFLTNAGTDNLAMVSPKAGQDPNHDMESHPVGTGPFKFKSRVPGESLIMERFEEYAWAPEPFENRGPAYLDEVELVFVPENEVRMGSLRSGDLQGSETIVPQDWAGFESDPAFTTFGISPPGVGKYVLINVQKYPTDDVRVREAIHRAINREEMIDVLWNGLFEISDGPIQKNVFGYWPGVEGQFPYDQEKSAELLDDAGWELQDDGFRYKDGDLLEIDMYTVEGFGIHDQFAEPFQNYLRQVGIQCNIIRLPGAVRRVHQTAGDHHLLPGIFSGVDPDALLRRQYHSDDIGEGGQNASFFSDPHVDDLLERAMATGDREERASIYEEVQRIVYNEQIAIVPIYEFRNLYAMQADYPGMKFNINAHPMFGDIYHAE